MFPRNRQRTGTILIVALWALAMLSVFAIQMGVGMGRKVALLSSLEDRVRLRSAAEAGVKKAVAVLRANFAINQTQYTVLAKEQLHNNPLEFSRIDLDGGVASVEFPFFDGGGVDSPEKYGIMDEASKINVNKIDTAVLASLISEVTQLTDEDSHHLAESIVDWRELGQSRLTGFYSDEYYENLEYPYPAKDADFEVPDELLLVQGMNDELFRQLSDFVTVYGDGNININTAPRPVLVALGLSGAVADKVLKARRGPDGIEATADDMVFAQTFDIASDVKRSVELDDAEVKEIDDVNGRGKMTTSSYYYSIKSRSVLAGRNKTIRCVFGTSENRILYWREE